MKEFIRNWLFKDEVERIEWYLARRKQELEGSYQNRVNYLEMKYAAIERENKHLQKVIMDYAATLTPSLVALKEK